MTFAIRRIGAEVADPPDRSPTVPANLGQDDRVTDDQTRTEGEVLPPDPAAYDSPRAAHARARGLSTPYIPGGRDPDPDGARREERFYGRLLLAMVVVIVLSGFVLGIVASLAGVAR